MAKREKRVVHTGITQNQYETAMGEYAVADARLQKIAATMDVQFAAIRDKYAFEASRLEATKEASRDILQAYAIENKDVLFGKKKSLENAHGTIGFRTGTPKLKTLKGFTWAAVTNLLKVHLPSYVRTVEEPAKDRLLLDRNDGKVAPLLAAIGVKVEQDETFFIELKKEGSNE